MKNDKNSEVKKKNSIVQTSAFLQQTYYGPIPPSSELEHYEKVLPGAADRIINMAEQQAKHRRQMEDKTLDANIKSERLGQLFGFIIFIVVILIGLTLIIMDKDVLGIVSVIGAVASIVTLFVYGRSKDCKNVGKRNRK